MAQYPTYSMPNTAKTFTSNISPKTMSMSKQCFFFLFLCIFFVLLSFHGVDSTFSTICSETLCNGVKIRYPFWKVPEPQIGNATRNVFCGYRGFGLNCSTDSKTFPILNLPGDTYYVKDINYDNESITLVDIDAYGQNCPRVRHNVTVETLPLYFRSEDSMNLSFYFNCSSEGYGNDFLQSTNQISCLDTGGSGNRSFVIEEGMEVAGFDWTMWCQDKVVAAVKESELAREGLVTGFVAAMNAGFVLDWGVAMNCSKCEEKKGRCGFNNRTGAFVCFCDNSAMLTDGKICKSGGGMNILPKVFIVTGSIIGAILSIAIIFHCLRKQSPSFIKSHRDIEKFIKQHGSFAPKRFSYPEVRKMTNSFTIKLGQGGFGTVYKGKLLDGTLVAVKLLSSSKGNGEEFINEVASISRTSHVNVVTLLGFCFKGNKRALIYEFMSNGSLDRFIHDDRNTARTCTQLGWERLSQIAVGIARGLEYLHRGCTTRILHFDIKPHNILLDEDFCPKISDFGLSKLCLKKESIVSMLDTRGTIGYIAPEVFNKNFGGVSYKSDVYSYGMLLIEIVGGKNEFATEGGRSSSVYFPDQIYRRLEVGHCLGPQDHKTTEENEIVRKMTVVGLWCIQTLPSQRPTMSKVIELLEGSTEALQIPPKPTLSTPPRSSEDYLSTSVLL